MLKMSMKLKTWRENFRKSLIEEMTSPYRECRSWNGTAYHIRDIRQEDQNSLCGYEPLNDTQTLTREIFLNSFNFQNTNWHYCRECSTKFLAISEPKE